MGRQAASVTWVKLCPVFCPAAVDRNLVKALHTSCCNPIEQRAAEASFIRTQSYKSSLFAAPWPMTAHLKYLVNMVHYTKSIVIQEIKYINDWSIFSPVTIMTLYSSKRNIFAKTQNLFWHSFDIWTGVECFCSFNSLYERNRQSNLQ